MTASRSYSSSHLLSLPVGTKKQLCPESALLALWSGGKIVSGRGTHFVAHLFLHACHVRQGATYADIDCGSLGCCHVSDDCRIAVFPFLSDVVEVKTGSGSTAHWPIHFLRLNGWQRHSFAQLITLLDIDGIGQNWEDSNISARSATSRRECASR